MRVYYNLVSPGYWQAMGIPLLRGRDFDERDRVDGGDDRQPWNVAIVNRELAEHFFPTQDPIGRRVGCCHGPGAKPAIRIVGMVENSLFGGPRAGVRRQVFLPYLESATPAAVTFYARTMKPSAAIFAALRGIVAKLDESVPVYGLQVAFSGLSPQSIALYQVNVVVPQNISTGSQPVVMTLGGVSSQISTIVVQ